jgi:penicillin G amidase
MTSPTIAVPQPRARSNALRVLAVLLLVLLLAAAGLSAYFYSVARAALPQLDGELKVEGLTAPVKVTRDGHGVPTIEAANFPDLFFAQGYVTAQDRLWQLDAMRRFAAGELSEILGEGQLAHDRQQRILGLRDAARHSLEIASPRDRSFFEAYARGVNAYMEAPHDRLPLEFRILRYTPRRWTAEDCVLMGTSMVQNLNHGAYQRALQREKILATLGAELAADMFVSSTWHDRLPTKGPERLDEPDAEEDDDSAVTKLFTTGSSASPFPPTEDVSPVTPGSNNWVVSGAHTVSGKPLLSNDMHLGHQLPNLWYEVHLRSGNYDVAGVSLPGVPFVIVGHNQRIAWGFTNVEPTVEDLYVETFNAQGQYQTPQGWRDPDHRREVIHVKGKPDVTVDVAVTRHGPIITDLIPDESRKLALRWTLYDGMHDPFFDVNSAQNWEEFRKAFSIFDSPGQNVMYADVDGHIGYQTTGHFPIRSGGNGSVPVSGSNDDHEWTGYIPFEKLPSILDPSWGIIATANARIIPDAFPYSISNDWDAPWRTERIYHVLESGKKLAPADMLALQTDIYSAFDRFCAERFVYALDHTPNLSARAQQARELMRDWDGKMSIDSAAATIEVRSNRMLARLLLEPQLHAGQKNLSPNIQPLDFSDLHWSMMSIWMENILLKQPKRWLPENYPNYDAVIAAAVEAVVRDPDTPKNLADWNWGSVSLIEIQNPVLGKVPVLRHWTGTGVLPEPGDGLTVKQVGKSFGPSERFTADLSNLDQSTLNVVTGQGGNFLSPYYMDQWRAWYEGSSFTLPYSPAATEKTKAHRLLLTP